MPRRSDDEYRALIEPVARQLLGEPNPRLSTPTELRWGNNGSLVVDRQNGRAYDHEQKEGGGTLWLIGRVQLVDLAHAGVWLDANFPPEKPIKANGHDRRANPITKTYDYVSAESVLLSQVCRKANPKTFLQRRPVPVDAKHPDGWDWSTKGVPQVPYRLPELLAAIAAGREILIAEGEKDVDNLIAAGFAATTNIGGAGKWRRELNQYFKGASVVVIGDHDPQSRNKATGELEWHPDGRPVLRGQDHAEDVAASLSGVAKRVRLLRDLADAWPECPPKGDVSDYLAAGHDVWDLEALIAKLADYGGELRAPAPVSDDVEALALDPRPITAIPPRRWLYGHFLQFGSASVLGATDGLGKGFVTTGIMLSIIFGQALLGERVWRSGPVAVITYEDDRVEWERRIAAACLRYGLSFAEAMKSIRFIHHKDEARMVFAQRDEAGRMRFPDSAAIVRELRACGAILLVVDPFNAAHELDDGNNNVQIARVAQEVTRVAAVAGVAALVLHHTRKGATGEVDDLMGATSLRATFRNTRIMVRMTPQQAEELGISPDQAFRYFRIGGTKENYAPPVDKAFWFKLESQSLDNGDDDYPDGDDMAVATVWKPPSAFAGVGLVVLERVFAKLREGVLDDEGRTWWYSPDSRAKTSVIDLLMAEAGIAKAQAIAAVKTWMEHGVVRSEEYKNPQRNPGLRIVLDEDKVSAILAPLRVPMGDDDG